ncbi:MAG: FmdB family zinc ribbon protein [Pseudomonadota bacterium]
MPIYEYECTACGLVAEAFQKISDKPLTRCHTCSGKLRKLISNSAFHLKGSGWYVTDYAKKPGKTSPAETSATPKEPSPPPTTSEKPSASSASVPSDGK